MSVALDLDSLLAPQPVPARRPGLRVVGREPEPLARPESVPSAPLASVSVLRAPSSASVPLRLTRRGVAVLAVLTAALGLALVWVAAASARASADGASSAAVHGPAVVTVHPGDTLWALAARVAPGRDPLAEVADLRRINHLADPALTPGQTLRVR